jgi:hypothetical protein
MNPDGHAQTHFNSDYPIAFQGAHVDVMNIAEENYVQVGAHYLPSGFMDVIRYSIGHELFHVIGGRHQNPAPLTPETDPDAVRQRILADLNGLAAGADAELDSDGDGFPDWLEGLLCSDPFNDGSTPLRHDGSAAMFPVTVEVKAVPATPAVLAVGSRRLLIDRTGTWTFWLDEGAAWPVSLWSAQGGWVRLSLTAGGGCAAFQPGGAGAAAFGDGMTLPPGAPVSAGLIAQPLVAIRAPTAARERGGTVCFHSAGRKSLAAKITPPMRGAYAWRLSGTPLPGNRPHVNLTMPKSGALGLSFTAEGASAAKTDWVDIHTCILPEEPAPAWCLAHDCEDALCACDHGNSSPVWCFLHNCDVSECSPPPVCPRHGCPYPECPADWCHEHDCTRDACARLHDPGSDDPDEPGDPGPGGDPGEPDEPDHPPWGRNENILLILNANDDDGDLQEDREQAPWTADEPDPDLAPLVPLGPACCQCPGHGWAEEPGAELASASSRVRLWRDTGKQTAFSGSIMQSQRVYAEGLAPSPGPWADALVWHWTETVHDGHETWQRHHYATNRVTVLGVALMPDADGDGAVASTLPGAPDHAVLVLSSNRTWHVGAASNALKKVRLSAYVGAGVPGTLRLHASGNARFRVWPAPASTNGTPLLSRTGSPDDVSIHDFPDRFTDLEVYAEFLGPGDAELTFEFYGPKYDRRHRFRAEATQKIVAWDIEFVHAEGEDEGQPMAHLPVFTPSDGIGKGEPVYDCPGSDLAFTLSPTNAAGLRSAAVTYLGASCVLTETAPDSLFFTNGASCVTLSGALLADTNVQEWVSASVTFPALGVTNAVYPCVETSAESSAFENTLFGLVFSAGAPSAVPRIADLRITTETLSDDTGLTETAPGSGAFTNGSFSVRLSAAAGTPRLAVTDGFGLSNAVFTVWETAPQSGVYRNYNPPVPTDLPASALAVPDFAPWRIRITGLPQDLLASVSLTTSVDSVTGTYGAGPSPLSFGDRTVTFSASGGGLLSDQAFILIPDGELDADPPPGYTPLRIDAEHLRWKNPMAHSVSAVAFLTGCTPVKKEVPPEKDALVWRSLDVGTSWGAGLNEAALIAQPIKDLRYTVDLHKKATKDWVMSRVKNKGVWYSMSHAKLLVSKSTGAVTFDGLELATEERIRTQDLEDRDLDYKLVMVDGCCSAMTQRLEEWDVRMEMPLNLLGGDAGIEAHKAAARANDNLVAECMDFADAFGADSAYMGWAWTMNPTAAQRWTSEFLNNLKGRKTVQQAHTAFLDQHNALAPTSDRDERFMKIYGATDNVIDKTTNTENAP